MRPARLFLLPLVLLTGLAACGPGPSDDAPTPAPRASLTDPSLSQKNLPPRTDPFSLAASPATESPNLFTDGSKATPASSTNPVNPMATLFIPDWFAKDLNSPDVDTRLRALDTWVLTAPVGSIDPLILAFGNDDEHVRTRAMELIEQDWARVAGAGE